MKFLILGATGMAGHMIGLYLHEAGHKVTGVSRRPMTLFSNVLCDATDLKGLESILSDGDYDAVVNCVGVLNQNAEDDKASAAFLNGFLPHFLVGATRQSQTKVIHLSTDCVFSGKSGNYTETSLRDGETFYDRSKALGEIEDTKNLTLRNSIIGPDLLPSGIGLLNWFMQQKGGIGGYTRAMWTGMTTLQLAKVIETAMYANAVGLYQMVPDHNISKYELLGLFNRYIRRDKIEINPVDSIVVDKTLIRTKYEPLPVVPDYETMVCELGQWMREHRQLYPHYQM